jgi:hypothetical protein
MTQHVYAIMSSCTALLVLALALAGFAEASQQSLAARSGAQARHLAEYEVRMRLFMRSLLLHRV